MSVFSSPQRPLSPRASAALADARPEVFWTDRPERPDPRPPLTGAAARTDLLVVGAGFTGLWAAIQAKEDDPAREVVVVEAGRLADGASGRNGGFVAPSLTHGLAQGVACWPDEIETLERLGAQNFADLQATLTAYGVEADFHKPGELTLALDEHQVDAVREAYELHRDHGLPVEHLDAERARARVDSPLYRSGFFDPEVGLVDPARLVWGLARAAESLGVRLHEHSRVTGFDAEGDGVRVQVEGGSIHARRVVIGTNASQGVLRRFSAWVLPVYDHVLMTEPLTPAQLGALRWEGREGLTDAGNQFHYYRRTLDDRILFGGYDANYHFPGRIDPALEQSDSSHGLLADHFFEIFPQLEGLRFTHRWAGVIDTTSRFTPVFGTALGGRMAYAIGYTGLGVASTRFGARVALDLVDGRDTEVTRLAMVRRKPIPFPPEPIRYAAVRATRSALAAEDRTGRRGTWLKVLDRMGVGFDS
ncbi:FAD-dependent oxidoreductase [Intrasporangium oryzae NRRL B-24470]|uniref:FAD-dependent oxidoreductase n=1 Tax=Intrasporangium oryzae NRRL B-24470 TaxID=1386089 RepID=W9G6I3_9MICO|nr:FAD-dependent oxidoreductase [Intrasporangium oryzae]EWT00917.1 FAD-dependent oxidoreductase [Intrasporangium oryzae NRRL B-24470]